MVAALGGLFAVGCSGPEDAREHRAAVENGGQPAEATAMVDDDDDDGEEEEENVELSQLPEAVKKAALAAVPGLVIEEAEKETSDGKVMYCVHGTANGTFYEIEVYADGTVNDIEQGEEDDEDED